MKMKALVGPVLALTMAAGTSVALAHGGGSYGPGFGMGPGMMGMGPGMMGMGPGMMGMMEMMGPGMMGGPGMMMGQGGMGGMGMMGPGMMGGMGMMGGPGMMGSGMGPLGMLDLSADQRSKIAQIQSDLRKRQWGTTGQVMDEQEKLQELLAAETPDPKKVGAAYAKIADLQRQMMEAGIEAHNRVQAVLTKEQREQLRQLGRGRGGPAGPGMGPGMGGGMRGG